MANSKTKVGMAVGSAFVAGMALAPVSNASENPFALQSLDRGYMVASNHMAGKCGAGKCGGNCKMADANKDGKVTKDEFMKTHESMFTVKDANKDGVLSGDEMKSGMEGKCGAGKCGAGKCGGMKAAPATPAAPAKPMEGKCGQGKCGGMK